MMTFLNTDRFPSFSRLGLSAIVLSATIVAACASEDPETADDTGDDVMNDDDSMAAGSAGDDTMTAGAGADDVAGAGADDTADDSAATGSEGWTFDAEAEMDDWQVDYAQVGDTEDPDLKAGSTITYDAADGDPNAGSLTVTIPFNEAQDTYQAALVAANFEPMDMTGKTVTARVRWDSGLSDDAENPGGTKLSLKSGDDWVYAAGERLNLETQGEWITLTAVLDNLPAEFTDFDPAQVRQIGIQIETSGSATAATTAVVHIDTVVY